jgi:hypothetical protein
MLRPSRWSSPERWKPGTRSFMRLTVRKKVDFPEPVGPIRAVMVPRVKERATFCRIVLLPNPSVRSLTSMTVEERSRSGSSA